MTTIRSFMTDDHRHCDDLFADAERGAAQKNREAAAQAFAGFSRAMRAHFASEEESLFPAFEAKTGMSGGPTQVMRMEHEQMRALIDDAAKALAAGSFDEYLGVAETLLIMMQQHNMKEENILYPMCDQHLAGEQADILRSLENGLATA